MAYCFDLTQLSKSVAGLPGRHPVDLLPFHRAASLKYTKLGLAYRGESIAPPAPERLAEAARCLTEFGLKVRIGG